MTGRTRILFAIVGAFAAALLVPAAAVADHGIAQKLRSQQEDVGLAPSIGSLEQANPLSQLAATPGALEPETPGSLEQVGHSPLLDRGMNAALAVKGDYAYVGSRTDGTHLNSGVLVVDVSDPSNPGVVNEIGPPLEGNVGETSREMRIWPEQELLMVLNHGCSALIHRCSGGEVAVSSTIRFYDISGANAADPQLVSTFFPSRSGAQIPHEFFLWVDPQRPQERALIYYTNPSRRDQELIVTDVSGARDGKFEEIAEFKVEIPANGMDNRLHSLSISNDGTRGYLAYLGGGFLVVDTTDFANESADPAVRLITPVEQRAFWTDPGAHSAVKLPGRPFALATDEVYGKLGGVLADHGCPWGWTRMIDIRDEARPEVVGEYRVGPHDFEDYCDDVPADQENFSSQSAHNPTLTPNLALITWHSRGFQLISTEDPQQPEQLAEFMPEPLPMVQTEDPALSMGQDKVVMWSYPIVKDGLIYVVDLRNGLYVLRYNGRCADELTDVGFLEGNSNLGDWGRFEAEGPGNGCAAPAAGADGSAGAGAGAGAGGSGGQSQAGTDSGGTQGATACTANRALTSARARGAGTRRLRIGFGRSGTRPVQVDVFQQSVGRRVVGERLVARFRDAGEAFTWNGRANVPGRRVRDGHYMVRFRLRSGNGVVDTRRIVLRRRGGRFQSRPGHFGRVSCRILRKFKLERPVFGGSTRRSLGIAYRLLQRARVSVTVLRKGRVIRRYRTVRRGAGQTYRLRLRQRGLARGDYRVRVRATQGGERQTRTLTSRKL